jgi:tetratricopeptide (TPR) repeat protein/transcriptional regulator with XRE-family HTH domain
MSNEKLKRRMREAGFTQAALADVVNAHLYAAGLEGTVSERTVRYWLTGKTRCPYPRQREALEAVFDCPITELGFKPRGGSSRSARPEDTVHRRRFIFASTGAALVATSAVGVSPPVARPRVGSSDVEHLLKKFAVLVTNDHRHGGKPTIEAHATALAEEALALQTRGSASQRVRAALYGCAASFMSSAMWAATDGRRFDAAQRHFHQAAALATMSGDPAIQFRIWSHAGSLYRHLARPSEALAANHVARRLSITHRDPMFASLGHARHAAIHGLIGDRRAVRQALGHAQDALDRADPDQHRPMWLTAFYDQAELESLGLAAYLSLGNYEEAEAHAHRSLAQRRPEMHRSRAITTARLACAQLGQDESETAVATATSIPADKANQHPRVAGMLAEFGDALHTIAPSSQAARTWDQFVNDSRRNPQ